MLGYGKLFTCPIPYSIQHFNKRFGQNIPVTEDDYIDIYKVDDPDVVFQRLATPIPFCNYCRHVGMDEWHLSKREMSEWA